jgi:DNA-binding transcriptional ArsR family regulator
VIDAIQGWLDGAPGPRLSLIDNNKEAQVPMRLFLEAWRDGILRALAPGPLALAELGLAIGTLDDGSLQETLADLREAGLIEARPDGGEGELYAVTDWLREGVGPLAAAIRCEMRLPGEAASPAPGDAETFLLLPLPLLELPPGLSGGCRLLVALPTSGAGAAGATARIEGGRVASFTADLEDSADSWAIGKTVAWLDAVVYGDTGQLEFGGDAGLAPAVLEALHTRLCGPGP